MAATRPGRLGVLVPFAVLAVLIAAAVAWMRPTRSEAYELHGFRWEQPVVGYSVEDERLAPYATESMRLWGEASTLRLAPGSSDIRIVVAPLLPPVHYDGQPAQANVQHGAGIIAGCEVRIDPSYFFALKEPTRQSVLTHEIGHCLGLDHSTVPSIMQSPFLYGFTDDDVMALQSLYGVPQPLNLGARVVAPGLAAGN